jgi:hypothetical protein
MEHRDDEPNELPNWRWMFDPNAERDPAEFDLEAQWAATGRGVKEWRAGHALRMWRGHAAMLARPAYDAQRGAYERAIAFGLARLQGIGTFDGLIAHYFDHRHDNRRGRYDGGRPVDPAPGTVERWVADAITWADDPTLQPALVEENAFWLRAKQVMRIATAR